tara:strand:- start:3319 stop:3876 length:558 start_codon:yes stop_codon:yes gene_type:complete
MRIIGGNLKSKEIIYLKSKTTRPLKDFVKENIFNILSHSKLFKINIENSNVLDLYSGIGSFGLECISRGANKVTFVEKDPKALEILKKNLQKLSIENKVETVRDTIINFLEKQDTEKFDIIFLDPPFAEDEYIAELKLIFKKKIYKNNYIIIIHRERKTKDKLKNILNPLLVKEYGRSKIIFANF